MTLWYLDTSVALHAILPWGDPRAQDWLESITRGGDTTFSSTLLQLESIRALRRERLDLDFARPVLDRINLVSIDDGVLRFASAIEPRIRSLDAIHLATCSLLGSGVTVATHDATMREVGSHLGLPSHDPLGAGAD